MIVISPTKSFLSKGGIVLDEQELKAIIHALIKDRDWIVKGEGDRYSELSIPQLDNLIAQLQEHQVEILTSKTKERGD